MNDDNRNVASVWQNDGQRILDNNWIDNRFNRRIRVLLVSKSLCSFPDSPHPLGGGCFDTRRTISAFIILYG